jgi:hypothetical protein
MSKAYAVGLVAALLAGAALAGDAPSTGPGPGLTDALRASEWQFRDRGEGLYEVPLKGLPSVWIEDGSRYVMVSALIGKLPKQYSDRFLLALLSRNHRLYQGRYSLDRDVIWFELALPRAMVTPEALKTAIGVVAQESGGFAGAEPAPSEPSKQR